MRESERVREGEARGCRRVHIFESVTGKFSYLSCPGYMNDNADYTLYYCDSSKLRSSAVLLWSFV